jgi:hypothetical protein
MSILIAALLVLLLLALLGGGWGYSHNWGPWGWSPLGLLIVVLVVLALTGNLH